MKTALLLLSMSLTTAAFAGNLFSIEKLTYDVTRSQKVNDVLFCKVIDLNRNLVSGCYNLNILQKHDVTTNANGEIILTSIHSTDSIKIGNKNENSFKLDDLDAANLKEISVDENSGFDVNLLSKKGIKLNTDIGCKAPFECDWNIFTKENKLSLEILLNNERLEKIKLN